MKPEAKFADLLGSRGWLTGGDTTGYTRDWLDKYGVPPLGVARPASTEETAAVVRLCHEHKIIVVPQGGGTGQVGASVACESQAIILSLSRLNTIESIDANDFTAVVGSGLVLEQLHTALAKQDLMFPLHLGSEGSAQIGGLVASNAGGSHAFRFGLMQDLVLGLEVVLPNGAIWDGTRRLIKDNAGFQLRKLFCGSEGRLGVVTRVVLKLYPAPKHQLTALIALPDLEAALEVGRSLRSAAGELLTALEFFDDNILQLALQNIPDLVWPMDEHAPIYLLTELASSLESIELGAILEHALAGAIESGLVDDAVLAQTESQRSAIWRVREDLPEGTLREGLQLKHDISVPVTQFPEFLATCAKQVEAILPGTRIWTFGHLGDGNIHYNLSPPIGQPDFSDKNTELNWAVYTLAEQYGGSFAAEHGIGRSKLAMADELRSLVERELMAKIHNALDPENLMNPGVVV